MSVLIKSSGRLEVFRGEYRLQPVLTLSSYVRTDLFSNMPARDCSESSEATTGEITVHAEIDEEKLSDFDAEDLKSAFETLRGLIDGTYLLRQLEALIDVFVRYSVMKRSS